MENKRETMMAFVGAAALCTALLLLASVAVICDMSSFRKKIERIFSVDFFSAPPMTAATQQESIALAGRQLVGESAGLFARPPDAPEVDPNLTENLPPAGKASLEVPAQAVAGIDLPQAELPQLAGLEVRKGGGGGDEADVLAIRRKVSAADDRFENVSDHRASLRKLTEEAPEQTALVPRLPDAPQPAPVASAPETGSPDSGFNLPSGSGVMLQELIRYRPPEGYPSLDSEIGADFAAENVNGRDYFRLSFFLRPQSTLPVLEKDVLFLVDVSQSITSEHIEAARSAIGAYIATLRPGDRWNIVKFSERSESFAKDFAFFTPGAPESRQIPRFLRRIPNQYMTDLFDATRSIIRGVPESRRPCNVFLISDGLANYTTWDVRKITEVFSRGNRDNFSIFTFMVGESGRPDLMRLLAYRSRGFFRQPAPGEELGASMLRFFRDYDRPVLACCVANYTNLQASGVYPQVLPNLYAGQPVVFHGKATDIGSFVVRVLGLGDNAGAKEFFFRPEGKRPEEGRGVRHEWAVGRAYGLVQNIIDAPDETVRMRELTEFRVFVQEQNLTELETMTRMLERNR